MRIVNKKAFYNYHILERIEVGIQLLGGEVKSIRGGRVDLSESFAKIINGEVFLVNALVPRYEAASAQGYDPQRTRKLLLHKNEVSSLIGKLSGSGTALVPLSAYIRNNIIKVELGVGKAKRRVDKREVIKERDEKRKVEQELRGKE